ncbi:hypothetical protein KP509_11G045600 [Ceratopteris richardii]|uniref:CCHC-type domain-containing protein n=1 Tax=Ceratopteris richardii TaxID=49495 RepID=A0A8T2TUX8_CERRI|nr:hypothetical protein KP509_11G045600 [Ceratopteris richardii]
MASIFPHFYGRFNEDAGEFLDNLEMAYLISGRDQETVKLRAFPLVLKEEARTWYNNLSNEATGSWETVRAAFLARYGKRETPEGLWQQLLSLRQVNLEDFSNYESKFQCIWNNWEASLGANEVAPQFLKRDRFISGLFPSLKQKVESQFPGTFEEALEVARVKCRKLKFQSSKVEKLEHMDIVPVVPVTQAENEGTSQQDILQKLTQQLEQLTLNLVRSQHDRPQREQNRGQRRQAQEFICYNCNECGHGMYNCPHPRRNPGDMYPVRRPPQYAQEQQQQQANIPPVPMAQGDQRQVNVLELTEEQETMDTMPIKRTRVQDKDRSQDEDSSMGTQIKKGKVAEGETNKRRRRPRRKIKMEDFPLGKGIEPYDLIEDISTQKPNITWPQLLQLSSKTRREWSKLVSTRRAKNKELNLIRANACDDVVPTVDAYVKGRRVSNVYVDGGAQMCVMIEKTMHRLGLDVTGPSAYQAKMANNSVVKCVGVIENLRITVCDIEVALDMYVIATKGEGYPIILGHPWLIAVKADQKWGSGLLVLKPNDRTKSVTYDLKDQKKEDHRYETIVDEESSCYDSDSSSEESTTENDSSTLEVMGVIFQGKEDGGKEDDLHVDIFR